MYRILKTKHLFIPHLNFKAILGSLKLHEKDYKFGVTRVFFRPGKYTEFDQLIKSDPESLKEMIKNLAKWLVRSRWWKAQFTAIASIKRKYIIEFRQPF